MEAGRLSTPESGPSPKSALCRQEGGLAGRGSTPSPLPAHAVAGMSPNAHSVNDVPAEPACVGGTQERSQECIEWRPQPSSRPNRRQPAAAQRPGRSRLLGPERSWEHETSSERIQLPETGPQGRIYRQLDAVGHTEWLPVRIQPGPLVSDSSGLVRNSNQ